MKRFVLYLLTTCVLIGFVYQRRADSQMNTVKELAPGVFFHEGDIRGRDTATTAGSSSRTTCW